MEKKTDNNRDYSRGVCGIPLFSACCNPFCDGNFSGRVALPGGCPCGEKNRDQKRDCGNDSSYSFVCGAGNTRLLGDFGDYGAASGGCGKYSRAFENRRENAGFLLWISGRGYRAQQRGNKKIFDGAGREYNGSFSFGAYSGKYREDCGNGKACDSIYFRTCCDVYFHFFYYGRYGKSAEKNKGIFLACRNPQSVSKVKGDNSRLF